MIGFDDILQAISKADALTPWPSEDTVASMDQLASAWKELGVDAESVFRVGMIYANTLVSERENDGSERSYMTTWICAFTAGVVAMKHAADSPMREAA